MKAQTFWFMGTGKFAALCLEGLTRRGLNITRIITGLPTRSGRNNRDNPSPVELTATALGLSVTRTGKLTENPELFRAFQAEDPTATFVIDFGQIIREPFLTDSAAIVRYFINIHPSYLPEYRGAAPIQRALLDGKTHTGVTVFKLVKAMDAGPVLAQERIEIGSNDNASDLYTRLAEIGCGLAAEAMKNPDDLTFTPQDDSRATFAPKLEKSESALSFTMSAAKFTNTVRALDMSGGAYVMVRGRRVKVWRASVCDDLKAETPGQVIESSGRLIVSCSDGSVELSEVQSEGKNRVSGLDWARGLRLKTGGSL